MMELKELREAVVLGARLLEKNRDVKQAEVFASSNDLTTLRLCFATNIPCNALEEPKSRDNFGLSVRVLFKNGKIGFGKHDSDISKNAVEKAFEKAKANAVLDKDFVSLPSPGKKPKLKNYHDKKIMKLDDNKAIDLAYSCLQGALETLYKKKFSGNCNITGEIDFLKERVAIANTNGINDYDESTIALGTLTTILEMEKDISGMWFDSSTHLKKFSPAKAGSVSAEKALASIKSDSLESGSYNVVLGRQAVADLLSHNFSPSISSVDAKAAPFDFSVLDSQFASEVLSIHDDALLPNAIGTKRITDEGLATGKTPIIEKGVFKNFLSNDYYMKKYAKKDERFLPSNGFRFGGGGRHYSSTPGVSATSMVVEAGNHRDPELIEEVKNGVYVGRIWYTYPVNGSTSADFSSTIRGDSYIIEGGEIKTGLVPNTMRINDNLHRLFNSIIGLSREKTASLVWGAEEVVVCPEIAFKKMKLERIAKGLY